MAKDVARRLAKVGFIAFAPDALFPLGGYPGNDDEGRAMQKTMDRAKYREKDSKINAQKEKDVEIIADWMLEMDKYNKKIAPFFTHNLQILHHKVYKIK